MTEAQDSPTESPLRSYEVPQAQKEDDRWAKIVIVLFLPVFSLLVVGFVLMARSVYSGSFFSPAFSRPADPASVSRVTSAPASNSPMQPSVDSNGSSGNTSWFSGGTLHRSTIRGWRSASYANRLATAADFIAASQNVDHGNLASFRQMATDLEACISTTAESGAADNEQTALISAMCTVELFPTGGSQVNSTSGGDSSWFRGGTLQKSTIREWRAASYANRLATAADFIVATQKVDYGDLAAFKKMATDLEICISTAAEGGAADNEQTSLVSAMCLVAMYP